MAPVARRLAVTAVALLSCCGPHGERDTAAPLPDSPSAEPVFHVRVELESDDRITAWRVVRDAPAPLRLLRGSLSPPDREPALAELEQILTKVCKEPGTREADGSSLIRLEIQSDPMRPFNYVQWLMTKAADPRVRIYRVSLLGPTARERLDLRLPKDRSCCPGRGIPTRELHLDCTQVRSSTGTVTRVRVTTELVTYDEGDMTPSGTQPIEDADPRDPEADPGGHAIDLAPTGDSWVSDSSSWAGIEHALRARWSPGERAVGIVRAPPPTGADCPHRDVLAGMLLLRALGAEQIVTEGAIAPLRERRDR